MGERTEATLYVPNRSQGRDSTGQKDISAVAPLSLSGLPLSRKKESAEKSDEKPTTANSLPESVKNRQPYLP